jgi:photosystem II stability/assembly factor-like uncharacterized protein
MGILIILIYVPLDRPVGYRAAFAPAALPKGAIYYTADAGRNWQSQTVPNSDVELWKISFVDACR